MQMDVLWGQFRFCHFIPSNFQVHISTVLDRPCTRTMFDGNPEVMIAIGCVTNDRLRESPPPGKCKHNVLVVFDC